MTDNELFVTLEPPVGTSYYTVIKTPTVASVGDNTIAGVVTDTFSVFETRQVQKQNFYPPPPDFVGPPAPDPLHYYKNWKTLKTTAEELIRTRDGQCGAWVDLFLKMLGQHGGASGARDLTIRPSDSAGAQGFAINDWKFLSPVPGGLSDGYTHANEYVGSWYGANTDGTRSCFKTCRRR